MAITRIAGVDIDMLLNGKLIGCAQTMDLDEKVDTASAVCRADGTAQGLGSATRAWKTAVAGANSWTASLDGLVRQTTGTDVPLNTTYKELIDLKDAGQPVTISFGTITSGTNRRTGLALITDVKTSAKDTGFATFAISLEGTGPLTWVLNV